MDDVCWSDATVLCFFIYGEKLLFSQRLPEQTLDFRLDLFFYQIWHDIHFTSLSDFMFMCTLRHACMFTVLYLLYLVCVCVFMCMCDSEPACHSVILCLSIHQSIHASPACCLCARRREKHEYFITWDECQSTSHYCLLDTLRPVQGVSRTKEALCSSHNNLCLWATADCKAPDSRIRVSVMDCSKIHKHDNWRKHLGLAWLTFGWFGYLWVFSKINTVVRQSEHTDR